MGYMIYVHTCTCEYGSLLHAYPACLRCLNCQYCRRKRNTIEPPAAAFDLTSCYESPHIHLVVVYNCERMGRFSRLFSSSKFQFALLCSQIFQLLNKMPVATAEYPQFSSLMRWMYFVHFNTCVPKVCTVSRPVFIVCDLLLQAHCHCYHSLITQILYIFYLTCSSYLQILLNKWIS